MSFSEAYLLHPATAVGSSVVEAPGGFDQHVQAGQESEGVVAAIVVNHGVVDDQGAVFRQRLYSFRKEHLFFFQIPVVEDVPQNQDVGFRQWIFKEIPGVETQARPESE